jgi:hypothetical protein
MKRFQLVLGFFLCTAAAFGQVAGGTITGTITDPAGASVANASVQARNVESGTVYPVQSTTTGNYTIPNLPVGTYELDVTATGFKKFVRQNLTVQAAQVLAVDVKLEIGQATESVTVSAEATMLKTESGDISQNVTLQSLDQLPMLQTGAAMAGSSGIRNPNNVVFATPGSYYVPNSSVKINGAPVNSQRYMVEGMDATNQGISFAPAQLQPSVDAVQETSVQTSSYLPEYGQAGGGYMNVTMKSGTNQLHGSAYDYFVNEVLNSAYPFTGTPFSHATENLRPAARRNDYGFSLGGPVVIPKVYNGKDKTFFFFNFEQFRETDMINNNPITVPTAAYRAGNFSGAEAAVGNRILGTDILGRPILENQIYNPLTRRLGPGGQTVADPYPGNVIPVSAMDPVALKIQNLIPLPTSSASFNNYLPTYSSVRHTTIPSVKVDQQIGNNGRLSFYWSFTHTDSPYSPIYGQSDGLPTPITEARGTFIHSHIERLNYDHTLTPTLLLHLGIGYQQNNFFDDAPVLNYNPAQQLGLSGATVNRNFPVFTGLCTNLAGGPTNPICSAAGGMQNMGPWAGQTHTYFEKPEGNASMTWVRGNHTYKLGGEFFLYNVPTVPYTNTAGSYGFSSFQTALPYLVNQGNFFGGVPNATGFPYASFLLGAANQANIAAPADYRNSQDHIGVYIQDSWKVTRTLTIDYGLRWDYGTYVGEEHGRVPDFSPATPNPTLGGYPGAFLYENNCNCNFAHNYPYAIGPRVGLAYQIAPKTVIRAGWGIIYNQTVYSALGIAATNTLTSTGIGLPAMTLVNGVPASAAPTWPNFNAGIAPTNPSGAQPLPAGVGLLDPNAGRPARQNMWNVGVQQEITPNFVVGVSYVANRGVWWSSPSMENYNALTPGRLTPYGLNAANPADSALLAGTLASAIVANPGRFKVPYAGFNPATNTLAQSLRPFPQFTDIPLVGDPLGKTWYDSVQVTANKRLSHNLMVQSNLAWQKSLQQGVDGNPNTFVGNPLVTYAGAVGNPNLAKSISSLDQPLVFEVSGTYTIPKLPSSDRGMFKVLSWVVQDWQVGTLLQYASGLPIPTPAASGSILPAGGNGLPLTSTLFQPTLMVPTGQPFYNVDVNCHCYNPMTTFVLNPHAWANPGLGQFGGAPFYDGYRYQRHPVENMNLGRVWRIKERYTINIRMEFTNIFNRAFYNNPFAANPFVPQTRNALGTTTGGFGYINTAPQATNFFGQPRSGQIVARFAF